MAKPKEETKEEVKKYEERQPNLSKKISLSRDKEWVIIKTIRTDIVHRNYLDKILEGEN